jgi:anti-sigma28 factor (negative regulator of flagellin synthesis)
MSNVINGGIPPKVLPPGAAEPGGELADIRPFQRFAQSSVPEEPAALNQFSGDAEMLAAMVTRLKTSSPPVRSNLVTSLRESIASGAYSPDLEKVAGAVSRVLADG